MNRLFGSVAFAILLGTAAYAQAYRPFPMEDGAWVESHGYLQPADECGYQYHSCGSHIRMGADTTVNDTTYVTLWQYQECWVQQTNPPSVPPWCVDWEYTVPTGLYALLRQDTAARTVYIRVPWEDQEYLLYDFTMGVGEYPETFGHPGGVEVLEMDSVELADGYHRRWTLSTENWDGPVHVVEGIGSDAGLLTVVPNTFEGHDRLECSGVGSVTIYVRGIDEGPWECNLSVTVEELPMGGHALLVYPNPANGMIHVDNERIQGTTGMMIDAWGQRVRSFRFIPGRNTIDVSALPPGVYLLRTSDGRTARVMTE